MNVYDEIDKLGLKIPAPILRPVNWKLEPFSVHGNLLFLSGHGPRRVDKVIYNKRLGDDMSIEEGKKAAQLCMLNLLSTTEQALGDLNRIEKILKVFGMVKCSSNFNHQPEVIDGASELLVSIFGDIGRHARTAVGMYDLPMGISVEIEMILSFKLL
jgi:enamine deaminase RidA (YjgF/YER057c/UK114 family)